LSPLLTMCHGCSALTDAPVAGRCPACAPDHLARDNARRMAHPRRLVYDDPRWPRSRQATFDRDGHTCVDCGRHQTELGPNERLVADHVEGLEAILERDGDPFDVDECATRCSTCSGRKDGGRR
jgi:hypothetical protein